MNTKTAFQHFNSYGVFCIAMYNQNIETRELDIEWENAIGLYDEFLNSKFNDPSQSELDCINKFMGSKS